MGIAPARMWIAAAVVVGLLAAAVAWNARSSQLGGSVSALEVKPVPKEAGPFQSPFVVSLSNHNWGLRQAQAERQGTTLSQQWKGPAKEAAEGPQEALPAAALRKAPAEEGRAASAPGVESAAASGEAVSKVIEPPSDDAAPASATKQTAQDQDLRGGLHIGGHSRLMDSFIGVVDVDESDVAKTINVHILRDEDYRYYFDLDSQTVPPGEKVMFVVDNTHFTPDECW